MMLNVVLVVNVWILLFAKAANLKNCSAKVTKNKNFRASFVISCLHEFAAAVEVVQVTLFQKYLFFKRLMGSTDQADPSCFYFRIS